MPFDPDNPNESSSFSTLYPDRLMDESVRRPTDLLSLTEALPGTMPYMTLQLTTGLEMHYRPDSPDASNDVATALASRLGHEGAHINGVVHFTGESGEADDAPGMDDETYCALYEELAAVCNGLGVRLWRKFRPGDTVLVRPDDYAPGDTLWTSGGAHRFMGLVDFPADSKTAQMFPGVQYFQCEDDFRMTASGSSYPTRAEHAPPGYWQRTGNQLLPAAH
ncbi:hypothetical protein OH782_41320 (plasmid) [Streptomyces sp. NBC_01544]|uniref:hypothetical protein n=1 Tax=Streptomyces sp. NBC_01544 TaxID=2975871 RepID=UPI002F914EFB